MMLKILSFLIGIIAIRIVLFYFLRTLPSIPSIYAQDTQYYYNNIIENNNSLLLNELTNIKNILDSKDN